MPITTRPINEEERLDFRRRLNAGFGNDLDKPEEGEDRFRALVPVDRTVGAFDGDQMVGTLAAHPFALTVPGGHPVQAAGTTMITVVNTHRRQGILRAMMTDHLDDTAGRGEPLAALWASEAPIYGRFGYGPATSRDVIAGARDAIRIDRPAEGRVSVIDGDAVADVLPAIFDRVRLATSGMLSRSAQWWEHNIVYDPESGREGATARRYVVSEVDGAPEGFAIYRQKANWDDFVPKGKVKVDEVVAATDQAHSALWSYLGQIDLFPIVEYWNLPTDDPLWWKLQNPRLVRRTNADALYVRVMDVSAALEARSYETDGSIRIEVEDPFLPANSGTYELAAVDGQGKVVAVDGDADVSIGIDALGALYLGGHNARSMAAAGLVQGTPEAVAALHRLFATVAAPWCNEVF